jgi:hypothetical protein
MKDSANHQMHESAGLFSIDPIPMNFPPPTTTAWSRFSLGALLIILYCFPIHPQALRNAHMLTPVHGMHEIRASHTATVLQDGRVLIAGGFKKGSDGHSQIYSLTAELFDPKTELFVRTGDMNVRRAGHTATLLPGGRVLITGGFMENGITASAEVYDPSSQTFLPVGSMSVARGASTATLLQSGDVLIAGGGDATVAASADLFHPSTNQFSPTGAMTVPRSGHTATLLPDGKVIMIGGANAHTVLSSAELYNPATGTFTPAGTMKLPRYKHASILLKDGHTLILGGSDERDWRGKYNTAEIYDWRSRKFTAIADMVSPRFKLSGAVVQLGNGNIVICGGSKTIEVFDFLTKRFQAAADLGQPHYYGTASLLNDRTILIVGGYTESVQSTDSAWIFKE